MTRNNAAVQTIRRKDLGENTVMNNIISQIPQRVSWYLSGFVDGEGSFNVALIPRSEYALRWKVYLTFNVAQKDKTVLALLKRYFKAGRLELRRDGVWNYSINDLRGLRDVVVPFFDTFGFLSASKKRNFSLFSQIVRIVDRGEHLTRSGLEKIITLREKLNEGKGRTRKYSRADYERSQESSEAIRQTPHQR